MLCCCLMIVHVTIYALSHSSAADVMCGGVGTCISGVRRCAGADYGTTCPAGTNAECGTGTCLFNKAVFEDVTAALVDLSANPPHVNNGFLVRSLWLSL